MISWIVLRLRDERAKRAHVTMSKNREKCIQSQKFIELNWSSTRNVSSNSFHPAIFFDKLCFFFGNLYLKNLQKFDNIYECCTVIAVEFS